MKERAEKIRDVVLMGKIYWLHILTGGTHSIVNGCKWAISVVFVHKAASTFFDPH